MKQLYSSFTELLNDIYNPVYLKISGFFTLIITPLSIAIGTFYKPVADMLLPILLIVGADLISGIFASLVVEKQKFTSDRLWVRKALVLGIFGFVLTVLLAFDLLLKKGLHEELSPIFTRAWIYFYISYEIVSILENVGRLKYKGEVLIPQIPTFIKKVKSLLRIEDDKTDKNVHKDGE